jgi:hypothetical protein
MSISERNENINFGEKINNYKNKWIRNIRRIDELSFRHETYRIPTRREREKQDSLEKLLGF